MKEGEKEREKGEKGREEGEPFSHLVHFHEHRLTPSSISILSLFPFFQIVSEENERVKIKVREKVKEKIRR